MGLLFGKKLSDGSVVSRKRVSDSQIDKKDIIEIGKNLSRRGIIVRPGERRRVEELISKAQSGGISREEIHDGLQEIVAKGGMSEEHASNVARELGLEEKRFRYFKDVSEMQAAQAKLDSRGNKEFKKIKDQELKARLDKSALLDKKIAGTSPGQKLGNKTDSAGNSSATKSKPTSVWSILNRPRS